MNAGILKMGKFDSLSNTEPFWEMLNINSVGELKLLFRCALYLQYDRVYVTVLFY